MDLLATLRFIQTCGFQVTPVQFLCAQSTSIAFEKRTLGGLAAKKRDAGRTKWRPIRWGLPTWSAGLPETCHDGVAPAFFRQNMDVAGLRRFLAFFG
jgi:hypothetical protein